jgi:hypothetical protein
MITFYCLRFETPPTWKARSPYLYPQEEGGPVVPQSTGFLFRRRAAVEVLEPSYTQGLTRNGSWFSVYSLGTDRTGNTASNSLSIVEYMSVAAISCRLLSYCLATSVCAGYTVLTVSRLATLSVACSLFCYQAVITGFTVHNRFRTNASRSYVTWRLLRSQSGCRSEWQSEPTEKLLTGIQPYVHKNVTK